MTPKRKVGRILIVAGSDSGGGAGIQADIKTVTMLGGHAMTAITAITAQNTLGVQTVHPVPTDMVVAQMRSCIDDIGVDAVKIGMIGSAATAHAVADVLEGLDVPIVFDPVMVATSGSVLADADTIAAFGRLIALATVIAPNLPELAALGGEDAVRATGAALLVKGGHGVGELIEDRLIAADGVETRWSSPRIDTPHTHGTGCTLASAIAEGLGRGLALRAAIDRARLFVRMALHEAPGLGGGHGPMGHQEVRLDCNLGGATLNQITLPATDHAASFAFYRALGLMPIVDSEGRYARFESAGGTTLSIETAEEIGGRPVVFLECGDLDRAVLAARAAGITVDDPVDQSWGWREARLFDPAGNALCLYTAGENRRFPPWRLRCPD
ncbi:bifunctional hydroxymethylpyrimidine kinase/phosphomethylpyrimidine kinase [Sphingomonas sp. SUN019]|uniref:bifunctional hydroxymethylpyrimidine kinase/phosphomethylpyrimidine kinase n=1 Tax=Sphingomonas sp. SUN019 TaxID=2937788 RepID=UPI0021644DB5|nr:bifunctional hydroxymethylpyrimidine kinase/phosphomethylpyrimidine kinase [Sphingomonas sp. SUN019]UVO50331.1 bifunctional hydroxymethylpyrimidine kinase/phosphomethylpyrimidine kinase [Sphingomonas sp. SUN019]